MILHATADKLRLDTDESGWCLTVDTSEGDRLVVNIHDVAYDFAGSIAVGQLMAWRHTGLRAEADHLGE